MASALRAGVFVLALGSALGATPAFSASLLPPDFFDRIPPAGEGQAGVEADELHFNSETGVITAAGGVGLSYVGYYATSDRMVFNQNTRELYLEGNVHIVDPTGVEYTADTVTVTNGFKDAVLNTMVMRTPDGAMVTGSRAHKISGTSTEVENGTYAPCGDCVDAKGRKIGWRVRTTNTLIKQGEYTELSQPVLEVLGVPVAWFPWMRVPDLNGDFVTGFSPPRYSYSDKIGHKLTLPYAYAINSDMGLLLEPSLVSSQGLLLGVIFNHSVKNVGAYSVAVHGIYQLNPGLFSPGFGDTNTRAALQTSGRFTPVSDWTLGWSYTEFTDPAFLPDYQISTSNPAINEVYAQYLTADTYLDARAQEFRLLGAVTQANQNKQAALLPNVQADHIVDFENGSRVKLSTDIIGVARAADSVAANGVNYRLGTQGFKLHGATQADWSQQLLFGPVAFTPSAGLRLDYASYDGASALQPGATSLLSATPIAALDMRVPFVAYDGRNTHLIEPVGQIYYRGGPTAPGITNDNAQSFTFDEANLFSYNRFSGTDRQETGLRANVGVHYQSNFEDGSYIDAVLGQTFHIAGANGLATPDAVNAGAGSGLDRTSSDIVAGARLGMGPVTLSAKARYDIAANRIAAVSTKATYAQDIWTLGVDYSYLAPDPARGFTGVQQDIGGSVGVTIADYWKLNAEAGWDITAGKMLGYGGGIVYDDGYFEAGASVTSSGPLIYDPQAFTYKLSFKLKAPDGTGIGYSGTPFK